MSHGPSIPPDLILTGKNGTSALGQIFFSGSDDWRRGRPQEALLAGSSEFKLSELEVYYGKLLHGFRKQLMYIILIFFPLSFFCLDFLSYLSFTSFNLDIKFDRTEYWPNHLKIEGIISKLI